MLARKYRSQSFDDVIGQDPVSRTLKNAIKQNRVAHAYLFCGTRGVGKTTMARILAKALNCLSADEPTAEPCCKCQGCIAINAGEDIDVIEIDGASNNGVEEVRKLRENAIYRPARSRHKIYIIDEVHMLSTSAFNALLKILEEPPAHVKFIFATTEPNKVLATIQSRCQRFDFASISTAKIADQLKDILKKEKIKYEENLVLAVAKMANGSMRDGLSLLDRLLSTGEEPLSFELLEQFLGCPDSEKVYRLVSAIADADAGAALTAVDDLITGGLNESQVVDALIDAMRDMMVAKSVDAKSDLLIMTAEQRQQVQQISEKFDIAAIIYNISVLEKLRWNVRNTDKARALLEAVVLRFALSEHFVNIESLLSGTHGEVKKKETNRVTAAPATSRQQSITHTANLNIKSLDDVKKSWQDILKFVGKASAPFLSQAEPIRFENNVLTLRFSPNGEVSKQYCENRKEQFEKMLTSNGVIVRLNFELGEKAAEQTKPAKPAANKNNGVKKDAVMNDPIVREIHSAFNLTNIELTLFDDEQMDLQ
ncbi:MAG: DNA polymerase III subunit gamma/tau [Phycisphaerae bacterium]|nr:DNA polymerase III subunit gamma/tau [Phycisphaerae bacterium]